MEILLVIFYISLFSYVILKTPFFSPSTLSKQYILAFFVIKIIAGFSYIYIHRNILDGGDIFTYFGDSQIIFNSLKTNPLHYLSLVFGTNNLAETPIHLKGYITEMKYWFDNGNYMMVRINALFHLFSFGYFSVHVIFISFLSLVGIYNIFRFFEPSFNGDKILLITFLFFTPSIVFWYSGLHKEAIVILALGLILNSYSHLINNEFKPKWIAAILLGTMLLLFVRFYVFAVFLPGLLALFVSHRVKKVPNLCIFASIYSLFALFAVMIHFYAPSFSPFAEMTIRQEHFFNSPGTSSYTIPILDGSIKSFVINMPRALLNSLIHPLPSNCSTFLCVLAMIESYILLGLMIVGLFRIKWIRVMNNPIINYCFFSSITLLILMGLIVNNSGALVRYKSIVLPFLFVGIYLATISKTPSIAPK